MRTIRLSPGVCALLAGLVMATALPRPAAAQDRTPASVAFGYTTVREKGPGDFPASVYRKGWLLSGAVPVWPRRLLVVAETGRNERTNIVDEAQTLSAMLVGGRWLLSRSGRLATFAQALVGKERFEEPGFEESGVAFQPGGGLDYRLAAGAGVRVQGDLRFSRQGEATFRNWRFFVGGVYQIGW